MIDHTDEQTDHTKGNANKQTDRLTDIQKAKKTDKQTDTRTEDKQTGTYAEDGKTGGQTNEWTERDHTDVVILRQRMIGEGFTVPMIVAGTSSLHDFKYGPLCMIFLDFSFITQHTFLMHMEMCQLFWEPEKSPKHIHNLPMNNNHFSLPGLV